MSHTDGAGAPSKMSFDEIKRIIGFSGNMYKRVKWHDSEIVVKTYLSPKDYYDTIQSIINNCTDENGFILIEFVDFAIRSNIIASYALIELPAKLDELFYTVYCSDLYDVVFESSNRNQIESIFRTVRTYISASIGGNSDER